MVALSTSGRTRGKNSPFERRRLASFPSIQDEADQSDEALAADPTLHNHIAVTLEP